VGECFGNVLGCGSEEIYVILDLYNDDFFFPFESFAPLYEVMQLINYVFKIAVRMVFIFNKVLF